MLVVANYTSGSTIAYQVNGDGSLSEPSSFHEHEGSGPHERQKSPHAHSVDFSANNQYVFVSDLGTDEVIVYKADVSAGTLERVGAGTAAPGSGPRHFAMHPTNKWGYSLGELASTVTQMSWSDGSLERIADPVSTLPEGFKERNSTAEIAIHPSGKTLYASNRGHHSIAVFSIGPTERRRHADRQRVDAGRDAPQLCDRSRRPMGSGRESGDGQRRRVLGRRGRRLTPNGQQITVDAPVCIDFLKM